MITESKSNPKKHLPTTPPSFPVSTLFLVPYLLPLPALSKWRQGERSGGYSHFITCSLWGCSLLRVRSPSLPLCSRMFCLDCNSMSYLEGYQW